MIPEAKELGYPARHLLYGKRKGVYRIIFHIREDEQHVRVWRVWNTSRYAVTAADVDVFLKQIETQLDARVHTITDAPAA